MVFVDLKKKIGYVILAIGLLLLAANTFFGVFKKESNLDDELKWEVKNAEKKVLEIDELIDYRERQGIKQSHIDQIVGEFKSKNVEVFVFQQDTPVYWTNQEYNIVAGNTNSFTIFEQNGVYLGSWNRVVGAQRWVFVTNIFNLSFPEIYGDSLLDPPGKQFKLSGANVKDALPIEFKGKLILPQEGKFFLSVTNDSTPKKYDIIFIIALLILTIGIYLVGLAKNNWRFPMANALLWATWNFLFIQGYTGESLHGIPYFSSEVFFLNWLCNSLAATFIWSVILFWIVRYFLVFLEQRKSQLPIALRTFICTLLLALSIILTYSVLIVAVSIIHKTEIHFDFTEILLVSRYTVSCIVILVLLMATIFTILNRIYDALFEYTFRTRILLGFLALSIASIFIWQFYDGFLLWITGIFWSLWYSTVLFKNFKFKYQNWVFQVLMPCVMLSLVVNRELRKKELSQRVKLASSFVIKTSKEVMEKLSEIEFSLAADFGILHYYTYQSESKKSFENRVKDLYFNELVDKFDVTVFNFDSSGRKVNGSNSVDYNTLNSIYRSEWSVQLSNNFYLINERRLRGSFLGKFTVTDDKSILGRYFILLTPHSNLSTGRLSDVIQKGATRDLIDRYNYSYAIYNRGKLSKHAGDYDYPVSSSLFHGQGVKETKNYSHFIQTDIYKNTIVISKPNEPFLVSSIQFTLLAFLGFIIVFLFYSLLWIEERFRSRLNPLRNRANSMTSKSIFFAAIHAENWYISRRLQVYITWLILSIFMVVIFLTINFFIQNNVERQQNNLRNKVVNIANKISGHVNLDDLENKYEVGLVYDMAESYETDINIYNKFGRLIVSTNPRLYKEKFVGNLMNPSVYQEFAKKSLSTTIVEENISDLNYISAYTVLTDNDLNVRGYVNLPYFSNRADLFKEISNYIVTVLNVFALIFVFSLIITYLVSNRITQPLNLVRNKLAQMKLGAKNTPIEWSHNDEIGLLVEEYNTMVAQLDNSLNKLSESEREGAWREMAKQVAHEIKNPLTPMRLSLQHLEYSMNRGDENLNEKLKKTISLLIRQIDSLSSMAEEFSSFAKMPEPKLENTLLNLVLSDAIVLMEKEMGKPITATLTDQNCYISADPHQLGRIFTNILKNAIQAIPEDRTAQVSVDLKISHDGAKAVVFIQDNGKGIPPELYDKIFSPNFSTKNSGMGLGLAITKKIIEQFNGTIAFSSVLDQGTNFTIIFPLLGDLSA